MRLGLDAIVGCNEVIFLFEEVIHFLQLRGICTLEKINNPETTSFWTQGWLSTKVVGLDENMRDQWDIFIMELNKAHIRIKKTPYELL